MNYPFKWALLGGSLMACVASGVRADDEHRYTASNAHWRAECGSCHLAYPPQLLNARDWKQIMGRLERHFGSDASMEPALVTEIQAFLQKHAGHRRAAKPADLPRITLSSWFVDEHDDVPAKLWKSDAVKSPSNCSACHRQAEQGDFSDDSVQLPK